jgi:hypothetical protein
MTRIEGSPGRCQNRPVLVERRNYELRLRWIHPDLRSCPPLLSQCWHGCRRRNCGRGRRAHRLECCGCHWPQCCGRYSRQRGNSSRRPRGGRSQGHCYRCRGRGHRRRNTRRGRRLRQKPARYAEKDHETRRDNQRRQSPPGAARRTRLTSACARLSWRLCLHGSSASISRRPTRSPTICVCRRSWLMPRRPV